MWISGPDNNGRFRYPYFNQTLHFLQLKGGFDMGLLLVTYDLNNEKKRPKIVDAIKNPYHWARLSESSYGIWTSDTPDKVYNRLTQFIDSDDRLYVINLKKPYAGFGDTRVNIWLNQKLPD